MLSLFGPRCMLRAVIVSLSGRQLSHLSATCDIRHLPDSIGVSVAAVVEPLIAIRVNSR